MKSKLVGSLILVLVASLAYAYPISSVTVFTAKTVAAGGSETSSAIDLTRIVNTGSFAIHYTISGSGTAKIEFATSATSGGTYVTYGTVIDTGKTAGTYYKPFSPPVTPYMKIIASEIGASNSITITAKLVVQ